MKKLISGAALLCTLTAMAGDYAIEFPSNADRISSFITIQNITKNMVEKLRVLDNQAREVRKLNSSSKTHFCMEVGKVSFANELLEQEIDRVTPPAPYMLNHEQADFLKIVSGLSNKASNNIYNLEQYCNGNFKLDIEEAKDLIREVKRIAVDTDIEINKRNYGELEDSLLAPMTIEEMQKVNSEEKVEIKEAKKKCTLF